MALTPACLFLAVGLSINDSHPQAPKYWQWDINKTVNPYGTVELGCEVGQFKVSALHKSSIPVNDYGQNSIEISYKFKLFR